jgi:hypothetical protein
MVAVSVKLLPVAAVVIAVVGEDVSPTISEVVVVVCDIVTVVAEEVLAVSSAAVVGAKTAVRELDPIASAVVDRDAVPPLTVTALPIAVPLFLKVTVPAAAAGEMVAVSVTLAPRAAVVIGVAGEDANPTTSEVEVVACDTVTVFAVEVLVLSSAAVVGVKIAVRELDPSASDVVARVATPLVTLTADPSAVLPPT